MAWNLGGQWKACKDAGDKHAETATLPVIAWGAPQRVTDALDPDGEGWDEEVEKKGKAAAAGSARADVVLEALEKTTTPVNFKPSVSPATTRIGRHGAKVKKGEYDLKGGSSKLSSKSSSSSSSSSDKGVKSREEAAAASSGAASDGEDKKGKKGGKSACPGGADKVCCQTPGVLAKLMCTCRVPQKEVNLGKCKDWKDGKTKGAGGKKESKSGGGFRRRRRRRLLENQLYDADNFRFVAPPSHRVLRMPIRLMHMIRMDQQRHEHYEQQAQTSLLQQQQHVKLAPGASRVWRGASANRRGLVDRASAVNDMHHDGHLSRRRSRFADGVINDEGVLLETEEQAQEQAMTWESTSMYGGEDPDCIEAAGGTESAGGEAEAMTKEKIIRIVNCVVVRPHAGCGPVIVTSATLGPTGADADYPGVEVFRGGPPHLNCPFQRPESEAAEGEAESEAESEAEAEAESEAEAEAEAEEAPEQPLCEMICDNEACRVQQRIACPGEAESECRSCECVSFEKDPKKKGDGKTTDCEDTWKPKVSRSRRRVVSLVTNPELVLSSSTHSTIGSLLKS
jgi:hypothetical protein